MGGIENHDGELRAPLLPTGWRPAGESGSADALTFSSIYDRYYRRLVRLAERHVNDAHLAEDVAQETLLRALRYFHAYDRSRPLWPWLRTIAVRIAQRDLQKVAAEWSTDMSSEDPGMEAMEDVAGERDRWAVLRSALSAVPNRQRAALVVRYVSDWTTADAAELFGMDENAFEQLLWRARRRLAAEYRRITAEDAGER